LGIHEDDVVVAFVGRNHPEKGFDRLVAAASAIEDSRVRFVALGAGTEHAPAPILGLGVSDAVHRALAASDVFVLPSRTEGMPNALLEAMACGLPAVVTDVGDCRTILGEAGIVLPADVDREGLAAALTALTAASPAERARLGALGRSRIEDEYSLATAREAYRAAWRTPAEPDRSHDVRT
jgi:glycosyltransferase involved in cell wall biosynthesis